MIPTTPFGHLVDVDPGEGRVDADPPLRAEVLVRRAGVVARGHRDVRDLLERVLARLARLPLDQVEDLVLPVEHEVVEVEQDLLRAGRAAPAPRTAAPRGRPRPRRPRRRASRAAGTAIGWPVNGAYVVLRSPPALARSPGGEPADQLGSTAYVARGSCSGSAGASRSGPGCVIYRAYDDMRRRWLPLSNLRVQPRPPRGRTVTGTEPIRASNQRDPP